MPTQTLANSILFELEDVGTRGLNLNQLMHLCIDSKDPTYDERYTFESELSKLFNQQKVFLNPGKIYTISKNKFEVPYQKPV